ncbi:MAG: LamG domain-containing protein [Candidatus Moraniibacteriota bacterium]
MHKFFITILIFIIPLIVFADNSGNSTGFVWSEKIGWIHFSGEDAGIDYGIKISSDQISGYVWSEKTGWISLNCLNDLSCNSQPYGVVSDGEGNMSGYAWSEKGGWINFNGTGAVEYQTQIDSDGNMTGYAWSEKVGWINSDDVGDYYGVTTEAGEAYCEDCVPCNPPVVAWNFDEGFGTTAYDSSFRGNNINNDGTLTNGPIWQNRDLCVSGKCLQFDGNDDYVNRTYDTDLSFKDNSFSIGGWLKTSTIVGPAYLFSRYDTAGWKVWLEADGDACFGIDDDNTWVDESSDDFICTAGKNYNDNNWHYILAKKDSLNGIYLYMDGQLIVSDESLTASGSLSGTNPVFYTGVNSDGISDHFFGFLDEFKLYDYARSEDQIKQDYNAGLSGVNSNRGTSVSIGDNSAKWMSDGLVGYWKMDESSWNGTTNEVRDVSGNNNHGTASGGSLPAGGRFGNGGNFDGVDDYVELKNINSNTGFSISTWAYVDDNTLYNQLGIVSTRTGVGNSIYRRSSIVR